MSYFLINFGKKLFPLELFELILSFDNFEIKRFSGIFIYFIIGRKVIFIRFCIKVNFVNCVTFQKKNVLKNGCSKFWEIEIKLVQCHLGTLPANKTRDNILKEPSE